MTKTEQRAFVRVLTKNVRDEILRYDFPKNWEGHELREFIAEHFERERLSTMKRKPLAHGTYDRKRAQHYRADVYMMKANEPKRAAK